MAYNARVYRIFIASPSDVEEEREIIARIIREWNDLHSFERKVVLLPLRWETHSAPELGKRPQDLINTEIVDNADMAVGVFWTRIGTPTGEFASGTIEEIERLGAAGKIVMCYFSKAKAELDSLDLEQFKALKEFKKKTYPNGLIETYSNVVEFRDKFAKQLEIKIRTLISKDSSTDAQTSETKPNLEINFINPVSKEVIGNVYKVNPKIVSYNKKDYEAIPEYTKNVKDAVIGFNRKYYKQYFDYIKDGWSYSPIQFSMKNISTIAIRDIFIEIICPKDPNFQLTNRITEKPEKSSGMSFSFSGLDGALSKSRMILSKTESSNKIQLTYDALQPQRSVTIEHPLFITGTQKKTIELNLNIYADCFAIPLNRRLKISIDPQKVNKTPLEILEELEVVEK